MAGLRVTLLMENRIANRDQFSMKLFAFDAKSRQKKQGTDTTENTGKKVNSVYTGETSLTLRERMVGVRGEGARGGGHLNDYEKWPRKESHDKTLAQLTQGRGEGKVRCQDHQELHLQYGQAALGVHQNQEEAPGAGEGGSETPEQ